MNSVIRGRLVGWSGPGVRQVARCRRNDASRSHELCLVRSAPYYAFASIVSVRCEPVAEQFLTVPEVATRLRITPETVRRWLRAGKLHGVLLGGDKMGYRIAETEVTRLVVSAPASAR